MDLPQWVIVIGAIGGFLATWVGVLYSIHRGILALQGWFSHDVLGPYLTPIRDDMGSVKDQVAQIAKERQIDRQLLMEHDKFIYILLGKQFGGIPDLNAVVAEVTLRKENPK